MLDQELVEQNIVSVPHRKKVIMDGPVYSNPLALKYVNIVWEKDKPRYIVKDVTQEKGKTFYKCVKRVADVILSLMALIVLFIPMLIVGLIVKLDSKGPVLYKQERLGLDGKCFTILKFRSMKSDAEKNGAKWAEENDDRVTRVGNFIRKTRIDELPQLVNILLGQMSIVGPRPERKCFYDEFSKYIDGFDKRLKVKPGLTGMAQVCGGYNLKPEEKIVYDVKYIEICSIITDLKCIFKTVGIVFNHNGAR